MALLIALSVSFVIRHIKNIIDDTVQHKDSTLDKVSCSSFIRLENLCEDTFTITPAVDDPEKTLTENEDLLKNIEIPDFNDTLEEVDFILSLGLKLKQEGKINFPTPPPDRIVKNSHNLSVHMTTTAESSPKSSRSQSKSGARRISRVISPIPFPDYPTPTCRSNIFSQVIKYFSITQNVVLIN